MNLLDHASIYISTPSLSSITTTLKEHHQRTSIFGAINRQDAALLLVYKVARLRPVLDQFSWSTSSISC